MITKSVDWQQLSIPFVFLSLQNAPLSLISLRGWWNWTISESFLFSESMLICSVLICELEGTQSTHRVRTYSILLLTLTLTFLSFAQDISIKMHLLTLWPWSLNPKISTASQGHSLYQVAHFSIIRFWVMPNKQTDRQTKKTDGRFKNPTYADQHSQHG